METNWYKVYAIAQIILIFMMIFGGIYFYFKIKNREYLFQHVLDYTLDNYNLYSCNCITKDGSQFVFNHDNASIISSSVSKLGIDPGVIK